LVLGIQIPQDILEIEHFESKAKYILIVEKNASFQKIINEGLLKKSKCTFVMITVSYILGTYYNYQIYILFIFNTIILTKSYLY